MRQLVELLENRVLLSVSLNAAGWTQVTPSTDSRLIYVSSSAGSNTNTGLSASSPVKTIAKGESLLRNGMPDELLLKAGDTFNDNFGVWQWSGRSAQEPMLISSYGSGVRPTIDVSNSTGLNTNAGALSNVAIIGIAFYAISRDPANGPVNNPSTSDIGIRWLASGSNLLVENCLFDYASAGLTVTGGSGGPFSNFVFRRNAVLNCYGIAPTDSSGLFASFVYGLDIEENIFDHNGWNATVSGAQPTQFNHNLYIQADCTGLIFKNNISARASNYGLEARCGGQIIDNLFIQNNLEVNGGTHSIPAGGMSVTCDGNVFVGSNPNGVSRNTAIEVYNDLNPDFDNTITNNLMIADSNSVGSAICILYNDLFPNEAEATGVNNLTISNNIVYQWRSGVQIDSPLTFGGTGQYSINGLDIKNNQFVAPTSGTFINQQPVYVASAETWQNNDYVSSTTPTTAFELAGKYLTAAGWQQAVEPTATSQMPAYPDSSLTIASYDAYLGGTNNLQAFMTTADSLSSANWNSNYTAAGAINYFQEGFGMTTTAGVALGTSGTSASRSLSHQTFALTRSPLANVQVTLKLTQLVTGKTTSFTLTFTANNWNVAQSIPSSDILGWADGVSYSVSGSVRSQDQAFNGGISPSSLSSVLGFSLVPTSILPTVVSAPSAAASTVNSVQQVATVHTAPTAGVELGTSGISAQRSLSNQTFALTRAPAANVQVTLKLTQLVTGKTTSFNLTFTSTNWNIAQSIPRSAIAGWTDSVAYNVSGSVRSQDQAFNGSIIASAMSTILGFSLVPTSMPPTPVTLPSALAKMF